MWADFTRLVVHFIPVWSTGEYWRVTLHPCGHKVKIPKQPGDDFPPTHVRCSKCFYKARALERKTVDTVKALLKTGPQ